MTSVFLQGGLANMMFQIGFIESFGRAHGFGVSYSNLNNNFAYIKTAFTRSPYADEYLGIFKNIDWQKNPIYGNETRPIIEIPFHFTQVPVQDNVIYKGYFQSEKYFGDKDFVRWLFKPADTVKKFKQTDDCFIHVRRADYLKQQDFHPVMDMDYYRKAIEMMRDDGVTRFVVFSDDIKWCMNNFRGDEFSFPQGKDYEDLFHMASCENAIIANSGLSWMGAWLGRGDKNVIAPKKWLGEKCKDDTRDIVPLRWRRI